jgi:hypothetical protein
VQDPEKTAFVGAGDIIFSLRRDAEFHISVK